jgi:predicted TIM-barrel fold metal-dependent hydrolase
VLHVTYSSDTKPSSGVSLDRAFEAVGESVRRAAEEAARRLRNLGICHALVGGIAVGAHGAPRNTIDVDFLVGLEAFESSGVVLVHRSGVPVKVGGVAVDLLPRRGAGIRARARE